MEFLDLNPTIERVRGSCFGDIGEIMDIVWKPLPPTLVGPTKLLLRSRDIAKGCRVQVRVVDGFEYMRHQGWEDTFCEWDDAAVPNCIDDVGFLANSVGNSRSAYSYAAQQIALIATAGKYQQQTDAIVEDTDSDIDEEAREAEDEDKSDSPCED